MQYLTPILLLACGSVASAQTTVQPDSLDLPSIDLDDIVITAKKDVIKSDGAKLTYDVENDESSKGQTVLEVLRKTPMVTVDGNDNITINGSSNFKIYVNGREDQMLEANYQKMLKAMPAESVKNIEVITEPGAKYDAEGTGGILNLITESKTQRDGYSGNLGLNYGVRQAAAFAGVTAKLDKVYMSANATYADNGPALQSNTQESETLFLKNEENYRQRMTSRQDVKFLYIMTSLNMSWEPNSRNLFTWGGSYTNVKGTIKNNVGRTQMFDIDNKITSSYLTDGAGSLGNISANCNASYRFSFNDSGTHRIIAAYQFNFGRNKLDYDFQNINEPVNELDMVYNSGDAWWQMNRNHTYTREHTAQVDYSNPFGDGKHTLDVGLKGIFRHNMALSRGWVSESWENPPTQDLNMVNANQDQNIYAAYLSYSGTYNHIGLTAGLRYEHTMMGMDYREGLHKDYTRHLNDWVPNASLSWIFSPAHNLRLAYQMRISRPSLNQLDPYRTVVNTMAIEGNPDLSSEHSNSVSLTYTNFSRILGGNVKFQYTQVNNGIESLIYYEDFIQVNTYDNIGKRRIASLSGFLNINISNSMSMSLNGEISYTDLRAASIDEHNSGWGGRMGASWSWTGPWSLKFNAYGGSSFHNITLQGYNRGWYYYGLGIGRDFLKNKSLHVNINAGNFLSDSMKFKSYTNTADTRSWSSYTNKNWSIGLSVSWDFGIMKEKVKHTGLDITNDDQSTAKGNSGAISI